MKRKFLSLLLIGCLACGITANIPMTVSYGNEITQNNIESKEIKEGDKIQGFVVTDIKYDEATESQKISFKHIKTGAEMLVIKNSDLNRGFAVAFNTPAENNKGISHILEHSLLGGSEKYPINNMIFNLANNTYSSFINACTYQNSTAFPVTSQSEEQLMKLTDVYLDAVYNPLIVKDKKVFEREAWRYEMEDENSPLAVNGIVYNEMKGNYGNINLVSKYKTKSALFKDTNQGSVSGGEPQSIMNLSYEEFLNTYKKNYIPSNSFMVLYGDVNYEKFLKMINDNYLSSCDDKKVEITHSESKENEQLLKETFEFPASADYDCKNKSVINFALALPDIKKVTPDEIEGLALLSTLFNSNSSNLQINLQKSNIAQNYSCNFSIDSYQPIMYFTAENADESRFDEFYNIIVNEFTRLTKEGVDKDNIKSTIASAKCSKAFSRETPAYVSVLNACLMHNIFGDGSLDINSYLEEIEKKIDSGYFENLISKYLTENKRKVLTATVPKAGLLEENAKNFNAILKEKEDKMPKEEKENLIKYTQEFKKWIDTEPDKNVIQSFKALSSKDLPVEVKDFNITKSKEDDVDVYTADTDIKDAVNVKLVFDQSHLSSEELLYLDFYSDLLYSGISTDKHSEVSLENEIKNKSLGISYNLTALSKDKNENTSYPVFQLSYSSIKDNIKDMTDLSYEILLNSKIKDPYYINRAISTTKTAVLQNITRAQDSLINRGLAKENLKARYIDYFNGIEYYKFLFKLEKEFNENPNAVYDKLQSIVNKAFNKNNLTVLVAGNKESQNEVKQDLTYLTSKLNNNYYDKVKQELPIPAKREAITTNTDVSYTMITSSLEKSDVEYNSKYKVLSKILDDKVLIPELRLKGGSYSMNSQCLDNNFYYYVYRDSDFLNSLKVINNAGNYIKDINAQMDNTSLENYVISAFAEENYPIGEMSNASYMLNRYLQGYTLEDDKKILQEIKDTTKDNLKDADSVLDKFNQNQGYVIITSPEKAEANKELFDKIIPLN